MSNETRILELAKEALNSELTPEEVCAHCPEFIADVKERLRWSQGVEVMLEGLFPTTSTERARVSQSISEGRLPTIPGYAVVGLLGRGGAGVIYRVRHLKLNREVALKMLLSGEYASPAELARFMREARAVAALDHPNIVQVYDVSELENRPYFTMELVEGGSLARMLAGRPLDATRAAALASTLARAVHVAHGAGIVHRDLKPGNILLMPDGTPKVSDFGLASRFAEEASLTFNGAQLGTPSYMSPEQSSCAQSATGAAVDIYSLGAILYEMLTGRPPFHAATAVETQRQVVCDEPVRPSRLNPKLPRDLETICLKCLNKAPSARYSTAAALADDLDRFLRMEPIQARPAGAAERMAKWTRRRPAVAVAIAVTFLLLVVAGTSAVLIERRAAQFRRSVEADLAEVRKLEDAGRWTSAATALRQIKGQVDGEGSVDLRRRVDAVSRDLSLIARLDDIRLSRNTAGRLAFYQKRAEEDYAAAFAQFGLDAPREASAAAATKIKASPVHHALVAALDDWAVWTSDHKKRDWILDVARQSDPDPWRDRIRDVRTWDDPDTLAEIASEAPVTDASASILLAAADRLRKAGQNPSTLLRRIQQERPGDFWVNLVLGEVLDVYKQPAEAALYFRAALAARPEAAVSYSCVGDSLAHQGRHDEAVKYYMKALALDPRYARAKCNLAQVLKDTGRLDEAIAACNETLHLDPNYAWGHFIMASALRRLGRPEQAAEHYAVIYAAAPYSPAVQDQYRETLTQLGRFEDVQTVWRRSLDAKSAGFRKWTGYPELCLFLGDQQEYRRASEMMMKKLDWQGDLTAAEPMARVSLLIPASRNDADALALANTVADRGLVAKDRLTGRQYQFYQFLKGLAEYRGGHFDNAIAQMNGLRVMGPCPKLVVAMAQQEKGNDREARRALIDAVVNFDWRVAKADSRDFWIDHILRREAEAKVLPNFPALIDGSREPQDNDERIAMLATCQFRGLHRRCVELFSDALAADPNLMEMPTLNPGFVAASASSALSLCRGAHVSEQDCARLQSMACRWLSDELTIQMRRDRPEGSDSRAWLKRELTAWTNDPGLTNLQDPAALQSMPPKTRDECAAFWRALEEAIERL